MIAPLTARMWNSLTQTDVPPPGEVVKMLFVTQNPEGVTVADPKTFAWDTVNKNLYVKETGTGNTGWTVH